MADSIPNRSKREIRDTVRQKRSSLSGAEISAKSDAICSHLLAGLDATGTVMVYLSKPSEVQTHTLVRTLLARGWPVIVPIIEQETRSLRLSYLRDMSVLVASTFRVPEPVGSEIPAQASDVDTVIVPLLAFDRRGNRIGYGAGYYDRFLSRIPRAEKIGLAFSCQEVAAVPAEARDVRLDWVVTEQGRIRCRANG